MDGKSEFESPRLPEEVVAKQFSYWSEVLSTSGNQDPEDPEPLTTMSIDRTKDEYSKFTHESVDIARADPTLDDRADFFDNEIKTLGDESWLIICIRPMDIYRPQFGIDTSNPKKPKLSCASLWIIISNTGRSYEKTEFEYVYTLKSLKSSQSTRYWDPLLKKLPDPRECYRLTENAKDREEKQSKVRLLSGQNFERLSYLLKQHQEEKLEDALVVADRVLETRVLPNSLSDA